MRISARATLIVSFIFLRISTDTQPATASSNDHQTVSHVVRKSVHEVLPSGTFKTTSQTTGILSQQPFYSYKYYGELEELVEAHAYTIVGKSKKKLPKSELYSSDVVSNEFYSGYKKNVAQFTLGEKQSGVKFLHETIVENKEIMCLSSLYFINSADEQEDTIMNEIIIPSNFRLIFSASDCQKIPYLKIDSSSVGEGKRYRFYQIIANLDSSMKAHSTKWHQLRVLVLPGTNTDPWNYFNNWYVRLLKGRSLGEQGKKVCDSLSRNISNEDSLIRVFFDYVKTRVKYIDIENGINAFRPRDCEQVLFNKQGDCKDMAMLLTQMYQYKGIKARMALSSTIGHDYELDFPTLSSANHVFCLVQTANRNYYLDATERFGQYKLPSRQIQQTQAMACGEEGYQLLTVPALENHQNLALTHYALTCTPNSITGKLTATYKGCSMIEMQSHLLVYTKNKSIQEFAKMHNGKSIKLSNVEIKVFEDSLVCFADIVLDNSLIQHVGNTYYILNNFLPYIHHLPLQQDSTEALDTYYKIENKVQVDFNFQFEQPVKKIQNEVGKDGIHTKEIAYFVDKSFKKNKYSIQYTYQNNYLHIPEEQINNYNKVNYFINKNYHNAIILEF